MSEGDVEPIRALVGICGGPCTGKTTLAKWLARRLSERGLKSELLPEIARWIAQRGVRIDREMGPKDYDAFLEAYEARDSVATEGLAIADRTPIDHYSYLRVNANTDGDFLKRHHDAVLNAVKRYRLIFYLPIEFAMVDDHFRETSVDYQHKLDEAIRELLAGIDVPVVEVRGQKNERKRRALAELSAALGIGLHGAAAGG